MAHQARELFRDVAPVRHDRDLLLQAAWVEGRPGRLDELRDPLPEPRRVGCHRRVEAPEDRLSRRRERVEVPGEVRGEGRAFSAPHREERDEGLLTGLREGVPRGLRVDRRSGAEEVGDGREERERDRLLGRELVSKRREGHIGGARPCRVEVGEGGGAAVETHDPFDPAASEAGAEPLFEPCPVVRELGRQLQAQVEVAVVDGAKLQGQLAPTEGGGPDPLAGHAQDWHARAQVRRFLRFSSSILRWYSISKVAVPSWRFLIFERTSRSSSPSTSRWRRKIFVMVFRSVMSSA